jgi:hypothetical protein
MATKDAISTQWGWWQHLRAKLFGFQKKKKKLKFLFYFVKNNYQFFGFSKTSQNSPNTIFIFEPHKQHYIKIAHTKSIPKFYIFQNSKSKILFYLYQIST